MAKKLSDVVFVNEEKLKRAQDIVALLSRAPKNDNEVELKDRFSGILAEAEVKLDGNAVRFVYEKLGGLVRSEAEQKAAEKQAEEMKKARKKKEKED